MCIKKKQFFLEKDLFVIKENFQIYSLDFNIDGKYFAYCGNDHFVYKLISYKTIFSNNKNNFPR